MKFYTLILAFALSTLAQARQRPIYTISCNFLDNENQFIEAQVYGTEEKINFSKVQLISSNSMGTKKVLKTYRMEYIQEEFSLYLKFINEKDQLKFHVMMDDMGGMSTWKEKNISYDITCGGL